MVLTTARVLPSTTSNLDLPPPPAAIAYTTPAAGSDATSVTRSVVTITRAPAAMSIEQSPSIRTGTRFHSPNRGRHPPVRPDEQTSGRPLRRIDDANLGILLAVATGCDEFTGDRVEEKGARWIGDAQVDRPDRLEGAGVEHRDRNRSIQGGRHIGY